MKTHYKIFLIIFSILYAFHLDAQIYSAKGGSFIVFQETLEKNSEVSLKCNGENNGRYKWPTGPNDFITAYREAEKIFPGKTPLTDDDLKKILQFFEANEKQVPVHSFSPPIVMALGQGTFLQGERNLKSCEIESASPLKTLNYTDHIALARQSARFETSESDIRFVRLEIHFPKNTWIDSARVFKKVMGAPDSFQIYPFVFTTQLADRIEMHIRDTTKTIGEFLYTIQPIDQLGNLHLPLPEVYGHNYNEGSAPRIFNFHSVAGDDTKAVRLSWDCTVRPRVRAFEIYRAAEHIGPFTKIASLPPGDSVYVDHVQSVMRNFYYYIEIVDQLGKGTKSTTNFVTPHMKEIPQPPFDLTAVPAKKGVTIQWPVLDGMYHIRGYYIYRKSPGETEWTQASPFIPRSGQVMTFTDSSHTLKPHIEYVYAIKSESTSYLLSDLSPTTVSRPGTARNVPSPTGFAFRHLDDGSLMLFWDDMRKIDPFVTSYHLYTTDANGHPLKEVEGSPFDVSHNFWLHSGSASTSTSFVLQAEDAWENRSAFSRDLSPSATQFAISPGVILAHPSKSGYKLSWGLPDISSVKSIQLYEVVNEKTTLVQSLKPTVNFYDVAALTPDQSRTFFLKYKLADGTETEAGDVVVISK